MFKNVDAPVEIDGSYLKNSKEKWGKEEKDAWRLIEIQLQMNSIAGLSLDRELPERN